MRAIRTLAEQRDWCERDVEEHALDESCICRMAIENADGVTYHIIFGPHIGEGHFVYVSPGIRKLLGVPYYEFSEKLFIGMIEKFVPLSDEIPPRLNESRKKFIGGEIKSLRAKLLVRLPDGRQKWISDSSIPLINKESGKVTGAFGILQPASNDQEKPVNSEKSVEKGEILPNLGDAFLNNISHEIRTPLNAIVGFSILLTQSGVTEENRKEFVDIILRNTDHLLEIFNAITELSNIEAFNITIKREVINLNTLSREIFEKFLPKAVEKKLNLQVKEPDGNEAISFVSDSIKLTQILSNLVSNAIKFTNEGSIEFGYSLKDNRVEFFVSDTGIGILPEYQTLIFKKFFQVEQCKARCYEGTGLGLTIAKAYINMLGGEIWLKSEHGRGSVFYFNLPYARPSGLDRNGTYMLI